MVARFQYKLVECTDANNNTPLSEAAAGGTVIMHHRIPEMYIHLQCTQEIKD